MERSLPEIGSSVAAIAMLEGGVACAAASASAPLSDVEAVVNDDLPLLRAVLSHPLLIRNAAQLPGDMQVNMALAIKCAGDRGIAESYFPDSEKPRFGGPFRPNAAVLMLALRTVARTYAECVAV